MTKDFNTRKGIVDRCNASLTGMWVGVSKGDKGRAFTLEGNWDYHVKMGRVVQSIRRAIDVSSAGAVESVSV